MDEGQLRGGGGRGSTERYFSEDLAFAKKARNAGLGVYIDLDLTYEIKHLGVIEVMAERPVVQAVTATEPAKLLQAAAD